MPPSVPGAPSASRRSAGRSNGDSWQAPLAVTLNKELGEGSNLTRARVAQWVIAGAGAKPVPAWVAAVLPELARRAAADLRDEADALDELFADDGEGAPPAPGEPGEPAPPQDPGAQAVAVPDEEFDAQFDRWITAVMEAGPTPRQPEPEPEPAPPPEGWRSAYAEEHARRYPHLPSLKAT